MRLEYIVIQRLMWDARFRRSFIKDRDSALLGAYPDLPSSAVAMFRRAPVAGLEEEAYRRLASVHGACRTVFQLAHPLLQAFAGVGFFEDVAARVFENRDSSSGFVHGETMEVLEPVDGYVLGPLFLRVASDYLAAELAWLTRVLDYEWAAFVASRVASGWPPPHTQPPLAPGASLVWADYDLPALLTQVRRLDRARVDRETFRWRAVPSPGTYRAAVCPGSPGKARVFALSKAEFDELQAAVLQDRRETSQTLERMQAVGLVLDASFLCCSSEVLEQSRLDQLANVTEMVAH